MLSTTINRLRAGTLALSTINYQRIGPARGHPLRYARAPTNRSTINYQLSTVNCQLWIITNLMQRLRA
ncbi:MAG: hypothetical protein HC894_19800 [Microcoleus sp. SM1_3_4]|nr:hypothetical protein [Microcoleus sp. SM1_3_4]